MSAPLNVLIIEDDAGHAELLLRSLRRSGFEVAWARVDRLADVRAALERERWDILLSDHSLPGFKSFEVLTLLKVLAPLVPLVVVSGAIGEAEVVELLHRGVANFVDKAYLSRLVPAVERALDQAQLRREHAQAQAQLELLRAAVDGANDLVCVIEAGSERPRVVYANAAAERLTGMRPEQLMERGYEALFGARTDPAAIARLQRAIAAGGTATEELRHAAGDGSQRWIELALRPIAARPGRFVAVCRDVTERKRYEERLAELALHDSLTGLANRKLLEDRLAQEIARAKRGGGVAVLLIDLDGFKAANDRHGHAFGDALLREFAQRLRLAVREADTVARLGGDEFVVVIPNIADSGEAEATARRIVESAAVPFCIEGKSHPVFASLGIAIWPRDGEDGDALLRRADAGMYRAKLSGKHGYAFAN